MKALSPKARAGSKNANQICFALDPKLIDIINEMAEKEMRSRANMLSALVREALDARGVKA